MSQRRFLARIGGLTALLLVLAYVGSQLWPAVMPWPFMLLTIGLFFILSVAAFYFGARAALSKDANAFTRLIMVFTLTKLLVSAVFVIAWFRIVSPKSMMFVVPFFVVYIIYTVFETSVLTRLGKINVR